MDNDNNEKTRIDTSEQAKINDTDKQAIKQGVSVLDILQKIGDLKNNGILTDEEFQKLKSKILVNVEGEELLTPDTKYSRTISPHSSALSVTGDSWDRTGKADDFAVALHNT